MSNPEKGAIIFVPCVKWIKQGVAKANPEEVKLTEEELAKLLAEERAKHKDDFEEEDSENEMEEDFNDTDSFSKYNFKDYDKEDDSNPVSGLAGLTVYASNKEDPYVTIKDSEDEDSEEEDEEIKPTDNLILVGKVHGEGAVLQVYVYNDNGETLYVHHEILLPDIPLCVEWLNYDPASPTDGNLCAIGGMAPMIQVLDLDIIDAPEPAYILGEPVAPQNPISVHFKPKSKLSKKKAQNHEGHTDAVLDLSWNTNFTHVLASGSVDKTVLLWDLEKGSVHTKLTAFKDKIQTLKWHPFEGQTLLTGCCDKSANVFDCRSANSFKAWTLSGEIERVIWDHYNPYCFFASTDKGQVHYVDCRYEKPIWELGAHSQECTGLSLSSQCPGMLITSSSDSSLKVWDLADSRRPSCVWETDMQIGSVQCLDVCPDFPFVIAAGGDKKSCHFTVKDLSTNSQVQSFFSSRDLVVPVKVERTENTESGAGTSAETETDGEGDAAASDQEDVEPQAGPSNGHATGSVQTAMSKLKLSNGGPIRKPKLPPRAKIIQKKRKKASAKRDIFSKPT